jgi:membrane protein YdbS with pleckstrin-like domain
MTYTDTLLASGERILRRERQHWFILLGNARWGILALVVAIVLLLIRIMTGATGLLIDILGIVTLVLFVGGLVQIGWSWLRYQNEEYVITSRRLIHAHGVINKQATDSSLEKINDAVLYEGVFGRIFGFGDLDVLTASEEGDERLRMLREAKSFKKAMVEAKHELELELTRPTMPPLRSGEPRPSGEAGQPVAPPPAPAAMPVAPVAVPAAVAPAVPAPAPAAPPPAAMSPDEVTEALSRLGDLRDRGIVTPEEFEAKKRELLERL